jgi:hypothetical protein
VSQQRTTQTRAAIPAAKTCVPQPVTAVRQPDHPLLQLQKTIGNRAVQGLIARYADSTQAGEALEPDTHSINEIVATGLSTPSQPLDSETREFMESHLGHDFSGVRVHTDSAAAESSRAIHANAYTIGPDIVFGAGKYSPGDSAGKKLIAHELTHVVQQASAAGAGIQASGEDLRVSEPFHDSEREAEATAEQISTTAIPMERSTTVDSAPAAAVQRDSNEAGDHEKKDDETGGILSTVSDFLGNLAEGTGNEGLGKFLGGFSKGVDTGGAAAKRDIPGAISPILDVAGDVASDLGFEKVGAVAKGLGSGTDLGKAIAKGSPLERAKAVISTVSTLAEAGGFKLAEFGGKSIAELADVAEVGAAGAVGSLASVAGAGLTGWETGSWLSEHTSAGQTTVDAYAKMDSLLGAAAEAVGLKKKGDYHSTTLDLMENHPLLAAPVVGAEALVASVAGLTSGEADLLKRASGPVLKALQALQPNDNDENALVRD